MVILAGMTVNFRLSQKLNNKIKAGTLKEMPLDENPFADWSCHLFAADRTHYILLTNTKSLYSCLMYGKGITDDGKFIDRALSTIREFMEDDALESIFRDKIAPASATIHFAKALKRSVTGSMNDLIKHAGIALTEQVMSPHQKSGSIKRQRNRGLRSHSGQEDDLRNFPSSPIRLLTPFQDHGMLLCRILFAAPVRSSIDHKLKTV